MIETTNRIKFTPSVRDRVEFLSDRQSEKGPSAGYILHTFNGGRKCTIDHSDTLENFVCSKIQVSKRSTYQKTKTTLWMLV